MYENNQKQFTVQLLVGLGVFSITGDWVLVESDKSELGITLSDQELQGVSKNQFKNFVKKKSWYKPLKIPTRIEEQAF